MTDLIQKITLGRLKGKQAVTKGEKRTDFRAGDTVSVSVRVREGEKERIQIFKGIVLKVQGSGVGRSFTVRKVSEGIGVERTFPVACPSVDEVKVLARGKVRRSRLFYLRGLSGKAARIESELVQEQSKSKTKSSKEGMTPPVEAKPTQAESKKTTDKNK